MKLKALRGHFLDGNVQAVGSVYEAPDRLARMLIHTGKAIAMPELEQPVAKVEAKPVQKAKPMSTVTLPEIVAGASPMKGELHV